MKTPPGIGLRLLAFSTGMLLISSCGKEQAKPAAGSAEPQAGKPPVAARPPVEKKPPPPAPQGELPKMDPEKAKFIAVPSTPKDRADAPKVESRKAEVKAAEVVSKPVALPPKSPGPAAVTEETLPVVKKAEAK